MTVATPRTIDEALEKFTLIAGAGSEAENEACAMTLLAWAAGRPWTDHPPCAHETLANLVINANDSDTATARTRASLVKAGQEGVLDTWWIPSIVIAWALSIPKDAKPMTAHARAIYTMKRIAKWKASKGLSSDIDLHSANLSYADLHSANLRSADLSSADLHSANLSYADLSFANLSSADLRYADLRYANLRSADLRSADLHYADLSSAIGTPYGGMPAGWRLDDSGLWVAT